MDIPHGLSGQRGTVSDPGAGIDMDGARKSLEDEMAGEEMDDNEDDMILCAIIDMMGMVDGREGGGNSSGSHTGDKTSIGWRGRVSGSRSVFRDPSSRVGAYLGSDPRYPLWMIRNNFRVPRAMFVRLHGDLL